MNHRKTSRNSGHKRIRKTVGFLTEREVALLTKQVRTNSRMIERHIEVIDLLINKERCPKDANTLLSLRKRLQVAIEENDTFRKVLWRHLQMVEAQEAWVPSLDPIEFLVNRIKFRRQALIAQMAMK